MCVCGCLIHNVIEEIEVIETINGGQIKLPITGSFVSSSRSDNTDNMTVQSLQDVLSLQKPSSQTLHIRAHKASPTNVATFVSPLDSSWSLVGTKHCPSTQQSVVSELNTLANFRAERQC